MRKVWLELLSKDILALEKRKPHWAAGGFGNADYVIDCDYWARMPRLLLHEAVALSVGVEPKYLEHLLNQDEDVLNLIAKPLSFAKRRAEQFSRQFKLFRSYDKIDSKALLDWVEKFDLEVHTQALDAL